MVNIEEAKAYLGIDYDDDVVDANVKQALATAKKLIEGSVGEGLEDYLPDDPRVRQLVLIYTDELYSERGVAAKVSNATRRLVYDMELQLRLELRQAKEAAGA